MSAPGASNAMAIISTRREAMSLADLDGNWSIVARKMLVHGVRHTNRWGDVPCIDMRWEWCGSLGDEQIAYKRALLRGEIVTIQRSDAAGAILYAKKARNTHRLHKSVKPSLTPIRVMAIA